MCKGCTDALEIAKAFAAAKEPLEIKTYTMPRKAASINDWVTAARITNRVPQFYPVPYIAPTGLPSVAVFLTQDEAEEFANHLRDLYQWRVGPVGADVFTTYSEAADSIVAAWGPSDHDDEDPFVEEIMEDAFAPNGPTL